MTETPPSSPPTSRRRRTKAEAEEPAPPLPAEPVALQVPAEQPAAVPAPQPDGIERDLIPFPNSKLCRHDVVQVVDKDNRHWGQFIIVGDVLRGRVHGFYLTEGRKKEFITVDEVHCHFVGKSKVRSQQPCSPKWISDNRPS